MAVHLLGVGRVFAEHLVSVFILANGLAIELVVDFLDHGVTLLGHVVQSNLVAVVLTEQVYPSVLDQSLESLLVPWEDGVVLLHFFKGEVSFGVEEEQHIKVVLGDAILVSYPVSHNLPVLHEVVVVYSLLVLVVDQHIGCRLLGGLLFGDLLFEPLLRRR